MTCPKCGTERDDAQPACRACGLATDKMAGYASVRDAGIPEPVLAAWQRVEDAWTDEALHDELWKLVTATGCYPWAAGRYRAASIARPEDPIALRRIESIRRAAEVTMTASAAMKRDPTGTPYRSVTAVLAVLIFMVVLGLGYALIRSMQARDTDDNHQQVR